MKENIITIVFSMLVIWVFSHNAITGVKAPNGESTEEKLFREALSKGREYRSYYELVNETKKVVKAEDLISYCKSHGYLWNNDYKTKEIAKFGDYSTSVYKFYFLPKDEYVDYVFDWTDRTNSNAGQLISKGSVYFYNASTNSFDLLKNTALWTGGVVDGFVDGKGAGIWIKDGTHYYYFSGAFKRGFPLGKAIYRIVDTNVSSWGFSPREKQSNGKYGAGGPFREVEVGEMNDGRAVFRYLDSGDASNKGSNLYGFVDQNGSVVINPTYKTAGPFSNGRAAVSNDKEEFYIDKNGNFVDHTPRQKKIYADAKAKEDSIKAEKERERLAEEVMWLRVAADNGSAEAKYKLGICYFYGYGVTKNPAEAVKWFRKAADQGDVDAQYMLGVCYSYGEGVAKNPAEAVKWIRKAADQGSADAQYSLGNCYYNGSGVTKNPAEAVKWFRKAADNGSAEAQLMLGVCYSYGEGVAKNPAEAVKWTRKAADQGDAKAQYSLGKCYYNGYGVAKNPAEAVKWWRKAADQGIAEAQYNLGLCYYNGYGVSEDHAEAVKWYRKAADQGYADAQSSLGGCYLDGDGVPEDHTEAVKWFRKVADQGDAKAQLMLGVCYFDGEGVTKNYAEAVKWYRKAANQGIAEAQYSLGNCYYNGSGVTKNPAEAVKWFRKAADNGSAEAQYSLGLCYGKGEGVPKDLVEAVKWFVKAAEQGHENAKKALEVINE